MTPNELRKRREALLLTQAELAARLEVAPNTVARWERGERAIPPLLKHALQAVEDAHWAAVGADPCEHNRRIQAQADRLAAELEAQATPEEREAAERWFGRH